MDGQGAPAFPWVAAGSREPRLSVVVYGNTNLWVMAGVAGGLLWGWPAAFLALKPTLAPMALIGIGHRSFWVSIGALTVFALATLPMWFDYVNVSVNVRGLQPSYVLWGLPIVVLPLLALGGGSHQRRRLASMG